MVLRVKKTFIFLKELFRKPEPEEKFRYKDIFFFTRFIRSLWKFGVVFLFLTIITTALSSVLPLSSKVLIDFVIMKAGFEGVESFLTSIHLAPLAGPVKYLLGSVSLIVLVILIIGITIGVIRLFQNIIEVRLQQKVTFNIQTALFDHILRFPLSFLKEKQVGYLMSRVSYDIELLKDFFSRSIPQLATKTFYLFFISIILFSLNRKLTIVLFCILPVFALINFFFAKRVRAVSYREMENQALISKDMQEVLSGVEVIKSHVSEKHEVEKISGKLKNLFHTQLQTESLTSISNSLMSGTKFVITLLIVWLGVRETAKGAMTVGDVTAFVAYVFYLSGLVTSLSFYFIMLQSVFASMQRVIEMFNVVPEFLDDEKSRNLIKPERVKGEIRFENVSFSYEKDKPVLKNVTFTVHPGEIVALTGASGAGKTTLINLLLKFNLPESGQICLDGHDLKDIDTKWLRKQIGIVSQDVFLFNDTFESNIKYGKPAATMKEVVNAAQNAHIHHDIYQLKDGYKAAVGERGLKLSEGQRQRVSVARAFLKDPPILIFDEPTSALDVETEKALKSSLKKLTRNRTTFIVTHRMSMVEVATRIFVLDEGRVRESSRQ
jgi:subfamily B ATP-binding cassette protein MsbA